jgi:hypothetical protein
MVKRIWKKVKISEAVGDIWTCPCCRRPLFKEECEICGVLATRYREYVGRRDAVNLYGIAD